MDFESDSIIESTPRWPPSHAALPLWDADDLTTSPGKARGRFHTAVDLSSVDTAVEVTGRFHRPPTAPDLGSARSSFEDTPTLPGTARRAEAKMASVVTEVDDEGMLPLPAPAEDVDRAPGLDLHVETCRADRWFSGAQVRFDVATGLAHDLPLGRRSSRRRRPPSRLRVAIAAIAIGIGVGGAVATTTEAIDGEVQVTDTRRALPAVDRPAVRPSPAVTPLPAPPTPIVTPLEPD